MKSLLTTLVCGLLLFSVTSARADLVDELLSGEAVPASDANWNHGEQVGTDAEPSAAIVHDEAKSYASSLWAQEFEAAPGTADRAASLPAKPATANEFGFTAVPEPAAIALALGALAYFLIFCRRRTFA